MIPPEPEPPTPAAPLQIGYTGLTTFQYQNKNVYFYNDVKVRESDDDEWHDVYFSGTDAATHQDAHAFATLFNGEDFSTPWGWASSVYYRPLCLTALVREEESMVWDEYSVGGTVMSFSKAVPFEYTLEPNAYTQMLIDAIENDNYQFVIRSE